MSWTQYSAGVPYPILLETVTATNLSYVKRRALLAIGEFLNECNGVIHLDKIYVQHPKCFKDVSIMHLENTQTSHKVTRHQK